MSSRRVVVTGRGGPEVLRVVEGVVPTPRARQVRIRVEMAGVAFGDVMRRRGVLAPRCPFTPGYDVVGRVDALGDAVTGVELGQHVAVMMPSPGIGGYADHVCVPAKCLVRVPVGVEPADAVALGLNYITAFQLVHRFVPLAAGQSALVHGAAGGVGTALLEIGALAGVRLYGTASAPKHETVRARGATPIDYRNEDFVQRMAELEPRGVDAVFDSIGGAHLARSYQVLGPRGMLVGFGVSGDLAGGMLGVIRGMGVMLRLKLRPDGKHMRNYAITMSKGASPAHCRADWEKLLAMGAAGDLKPLVAARVPLAEVARAHEMLDTASVAGKVVLDCA